MTTQTIDPQHAADLADGDDGDRSGPWTRIAVQARRSRSYLVLRHADQTLWGLAFNNNATRKPWDTELDEPLPLVRLYPHEVTRVEYRTTPAEPSPAP